MQLPDFKKIVKHNEILLNQPKQATPQQRPNPFELTQYRDINLNDQPLQSAPSMVDSLLSNSIVPKEVIEKNWFIFHPDNVLTFLDEGRKSSKLLNFDIMKIDSLNCMPYNDYTFDIEKDFTVLRNVFETKLDRAQGLKGAEHTKNERIVLQSQFTEQRSITENNQMTSEGFWKRLIGRRK